MNLIAFLGIFLYLRSFVQFGSLRALVILFNGFLYHGLRNTENYNDPIIRLLRIYDLIINVCLVAYAVYYNSYIFTHALIAMIFFTIHFYVFDLLFVNMSKKNISILKNIFHVIGVQLPLSYALEHDMCFHSLDKTLC